MKFAFNKATTSQGRARMTLVGPSGSGKTYTALAIAKGLGKKVAVIDTENGSASKYADEFDFYVLRMEDFSPQNYVKAIQAAEEGGFDVVVIDSLSHAWIGKGGALEMVNNAEKRYHGNSFAAWRDVTPHHNAMVDAIVRCRSHLIATMRSKTDYVIETDDKGRKVPRKIGMAPIQRDGIEYEFDIVADMDLEHNMIVSKTRCRSLDGAVFHKPGLEVANLITAWLSDESQSIQVDKILVESPARTLTEVDMATVESPRVETKPRPRPRRSRKIELAPEPVAEPSADEQAAWRDAALGLKDAAVKHFNGDHELVLEALKHKEGVSNSRAISTSRLKSLTEELEVLASEGEASMRAQMLIWKQMLSQPAEELQAGILI